MNKVEISERFAKMWRDSRLEAGKSQEYVAKALGVSKKTVQNWEAGTSAPNQIMAFEWFDALGIPSLPYYLKLLDSNDIGNSSAAVSDSQVEDSLIQMIKSLSPDQRRKLLYILSGEHGSSVRGIIEMVTAHLHAPLRERVSVALAVATNYKIATVHKTDVAPDRVQPDIEFLEQSIFHALDAVYKYKECYSDIKE